MPTAGNRGMTVFFAEPAPHLGLPSPTVGRDANWPVSKGRSGGPVPHNQVTHKECRFATVSARGRHSPRPDQPEPVIAAAQNGPAGGTDTRTTSYYPDWRDRTVASSLTITNPDTFRNHRGQIIATLAPGGLVT